MVFAAACCCQTRSCSRSSPSRWSRLRWPLWHSAPQPASSAPLPTTQSALFSALLILELILPPPAHTEPTQPAPSCSTSKISAGQPATRSHQNACAICRTQKEDKADAKREALKRAGGGQDCGTPPLPPCPASMHRCVQGKVKQPLHLPAAASRLLAGAWPPWPLRGQLNARCRGRCRRLRRRPALRRSCAG